MRSGALAGNRPLSAGMLAALAAAAVLHLLLWQVSEPAILFNDFWKAYFPVAEHLWLDGLREGWPSLEVGAGGFVNLPIVGWLFVPFAPFGEPGAAWVYLAVGAAGTVAAWHLLARHVAAGQGLVLAVLFLLNGPLINSLREGNSTHLVLLALAGGLLLWRSGRDFWAGVLFAVCGIIKLPLLLLGLYFLARKRWTVVAGMVAATAGTGL
ncbi:MAG TPA: glycosyltransferase 87 family protein, partial [Reyranellaceae bacterium]|nr:glycosyltransferase 87 family protein [Reyranellaceae bacterium]